MLVKFSKLFGGLLATVTIAFGVSMIEVYLIPVRGTTLAFIVASTTSFFVVLPGVLLSFYWGFHSDGSIW